MKSAYLHSLIALVIRTVLEGAIMTLAGNLYTNIGLNDRAFTEDLLFETPSKSVTHCAVQCNSNKRVLTFTFHSGAGSCRAYASQKTSSSSFTADPGARTYSICTGGPTLSHECKSRLLGCRRAGLQQVKVDSLGIDVQVFCDDDWLVFLKRQDGSVDFYRGWQDYTDGFGSVSGEFWLGLETLHRMTTFQSYDLRVDLEDWENNKASVDYSNFSLASAADKYALNFGVCLGGTAGDGLDYHRGRPFSTSDADNDDAGWNCAIAHHGAWWYAACHSTNLCGQYKSSSAAPAGDGIAWSAFKGLTYSLKFAQMKIRPAG